MIKVTYLDVDNKSNCFTLAKTKDVRKHIDITLLFFKHKN